MLLFGIGLNKTGTTSLHDKLLKWGFKSYHYTDDSLPTAQLTELLLRGAPPPFNAIIDVPYVMTEFQRIAHDYPKAKFVCTRRDVESWIESRQHHLTWLKENRPEDDWANAPIDPDAWRIEHRERYVAIDEFFAGQPHRLLSLNIIAGDDAATLRDFLGMHESVDVDFKKLSWPPRN